jgi:hypothetical protein
MALHVFVIKEAELEDPQDLRARSRKFLNLTNERKQMSTKTMKQRIALVAVSALTAGLFSVVSSPVANASDITYAATTAVGVAGQVTIGTTPSTTGSALVGATTTLGEPDEMASVGFVTKTSSTGTVLGTTAIQFGDNANAASTPLNDTAGTLVVLAGAKIAWAATGAATQGVGVSAVLSGGGTLSGIVASANGSAVTATALNGSSTVAFVDAPSAHVTHLGGVLNVSAAVGSTLNLSFYNGANVNGTSSATAGELMASITFTVASASASGVYAASTSTVTIQAPVTKGTVAAGTAAFDNTDRIANGSVGIIYMELDDAYSANITGGVVAATATNGSTVVVADASGDTGAEAYAASSSFNTLSAAVAEMYVYVNQPVANTAGSTTVTITHDGVNVGTKTLNWSGDVASIAILSSTATSFANGATAACNAATSPAGAAGNVVYSAKDAAGNAVSLAVSPTVTGATGALLGATVGSGDSATAAHGCVRQTSALGYGVTTMIVPSTTLQGAGSFKLRVQNAAGVNVDSAAHNATVSNGSTNSFVASWSKATVTPGDLVTLTIKALDEKGNPMAAGNVNTGLALSVASGLTAVGSACADTTLMNSAGEISCQYAAGNTEGAYSYSIDLNTVTPQSATVGSVKVASATAATSNADVLKAIVSLIASINKQIAALQKALLRR